VIKIKFDNFSIDNEEIYLSLTEIEERINNFKLNQYLINLKLVTHLINLF